MSWCWHLLGMYWDVTLVTSDWLSAGCDPQDFFQSFQLQVLKTSQQRSFQLVLLLPKRGPRAFKSFCSALKQTEQEHLCDLLTRATEEEGRDVFLDVSSCFGSYQHSPSCGNHCRFVTICLHSLSSLRQRQQDDQGGWNEQTTRERWAEHAQEHTTRPELYASWGASTWFAASRLNAVRESLGCMISFSGAIFKQREWGEQQHVVPRPWLR